MLANRKGYIKDLKQSIDEFEETGGKKEFFNSVGVQTPELEKEEWSMGEEEFEKVVTEAREHLNKLQEAIDEEEKLLNTA